MEKSAVFDKENVIGPISCSPVLPSVQERIITGAKRQSTSPLSVLRDSQQDNTFDSPGRGNSHKVTQFFSTPLQASPDCKTPTNSWEEIRNLDEEELWIERTQVVTKEEHFLYCEVAKEIVNNIIENLPINSMENNHDHNESTDSGLAESPDETVVSEEKEEDVATDIKTIALDIESLQQPEQTLEKSVFEDNDFIHSCSDLDVTVKEILNDEVDPPTVLAEEAEDVPVHADDPEKTICPDEDEVNDLPKLHTQDVTDPVCDNDVSEIQLDEDSFTYSKAFALELDYLETVGNSDDGEHMNDLARQSLYVKFDPLVQAVKNGGLKEGPSNLANLDPAGFLFPSSISGSDLLVMDTPPNKATQSRLPLVSEFSNEEQNSSAITSAATPVDQLFDFSPTAKFAPKPETEEGRKRINGSITEEDSSLIQLLQYSKDDLEKAVTEAVAEEREKLLSEWKTQSDLHELEIKEQSKKVEILLVGKTKAENDIDEMKVVMHEYEQTMSQIIEERDKNEQQHHKSNMEVVQERDQLHHDLNNTEKSFAHLHARFEKLKTAVEVYKKNEETLKKVVGSLQEDLHKSEGKYQLLKKHAEKKIEEANVEMTRVQTNNKAEAAALQAALKRERAKNSSLQQNLDQKTSENDELTAICDELISKVGPIS